MIDFLRNSVSHIFLNELLDSVIIDGPQLHHLSNVLRIKNNDVISAACNGKVRPYIVSDIDKKNIQLEATSEGVEVKEKEIHIAVSLFKMDRLEWGISKAIETGASSITIGNTSRSSFAVDRKKIERVQARLNSIALSACSQSRRSNLVKVDIVDSLLEHAKGCENVFVCEPGESNMNTQIATPVTFVIGPEGGFSEKELDLFRDFAQTIEISPYILRAETAMAIAPTFINRRI